MGIRDETRLLNMGYEENDSGGTGIIKSDNILGWGVMIG